MGSHTTPHTPQSHAIGENNRRIVRNKASIYIVPNRTSAYDLHICAGQRCSHVLLHKVRTGCNLLQSRESCTTWQPSWQSFTIYCVPTILHMIVYVQYKNPPNRSQIHTYWLNSPNHFQKLAVYVQVHVHVKPTPPPPNPQRFPALPISGAAELRSCRLKDSDSNRPLLVGTLIVAVRLLSLNANLLGTITPPPPASLWEYLLHKKRFPFLPSHIIFTNTPIPSRLSILHQIMYRLTGDPHIHLNHAAGISLLTLYGQLCTI